MLVLVVLVPKVRLWLRRHAQIDLHFSINSVSLILLVSYCLWNH